GRRESFALFYGEFPKSSIHMTTTSSPAPLPNSMPSIPSEFHWMAETLVVADELAKYPDSTLKLAYLILDYLEGGYSPDDFRYVRNFVSHSVCHDPAVIAFVENELPSARVIDGVQFRRND